ncbi:MAG: phenylalanine--tRNA ligase subunit beta [Alphaproteobacteria bacterium]|nr:phenylalanine--tRNA ligase subunit beta [Alphaproteobacteria bacterium]
MKMSLSWLKDYLETEASLEEIALRLTMLGLVVDDIHEARKDLEAFSIVEIIEALPHPNAHRLQVCKVNIGSKILQIVCGAPNARVGLKTVLAPIGSQIPATKLTLKPIQIRGIDSQGMLCSAKELNLEGDAEGIIEVPDDAMVGKSYAAYIGLDDPVLDIEITPNRGDCLGAYGLARDLAAAGVGTLKPLKIPKIVDQGPSILKVRISPEAQKSCPFFAGRVIQGVQNKPSPAWLQQRLRTIGLRPISALVDITNYLAYDLGRPMHVFDADKISVDLQVRFSKTGEILKGLDGKTYTLDHDMTVVADQNGPLAIAGIIGGESSSCTEATTNVFIESALFEPVAVASTGRRLNIITDSRYRFERGVDADLIIPAIEIVTQFIIEHCGGIPGEIITAGILPSEKETISFNPHKVKTIGGVQLSNQHIEIILKNLGFTIEQASDAWRITVPSWRQDVALEADLIEELVRVHGYDNIPVVPLPLPQYTNPFRGKAGQDLRQKRAWIARRCLASRGLNEALTWSFVTHDNAQLFGGGDPALKLTNPISTDLSDMRPSLLSNLIAACQRNHNRGYPHEALFEVGSQFHSIHPEGEKIVVTGVRMGDATPRHWLQKQRPVDSFDVKADSMAVLEAFGIDRETLQITASAPGWYHPGRSGAILLGPKTVLAYFGEIHPQVLAQMDVQDAIVGFELFLDAVPSLRPKNKPLKISPYQPTERDFAFVVNQEVTAGQLISAVRKADRELIKDVVVFDVYQGKGVEEGKKSIALSVRFEPQEATLTDAQITALFDAIVENVKLTTGGELRS